MNSFGRYGGLYSVTALLIKDLKRYARLAWDRHGVQSPGGPDQLWPGQDPYSLSSAVQGHPPPSEGEESTVSEGDYSRSVFLKRAGFTIFFGLRPPVINSSFSHLAPAAARAPRGPRDTAREPPAPGTRPRQHSDGSSLLS